MELVVILGARSNPCDVQTENWENKLTIWTSGVPRGGGEVQTPPPEIPKDLQNHAKLNPIVKTVKNCWI